MTRCTQPISAEKGFTKKLRMGIWIGTQRLSAERDLSRKPRALLTEDSQGDMDRGRVASWEKLPLSFGRS